MRSVTCSSGGSPRSCTGFPEPHWTWSFWSRPPARTPSVCWRPLAEVGLGTARLVGPEEVLAQEVTIFQDLLRVDVFTAIPGVTFGEAWTRRAEAQVAGTTIHLMGLDDLVASKKACGRPKDLQDVEDLERIRRARPRDDS